MALNTLHPPSTASKDAALKQADAMLQMPIMTPVSSDTWGVKGIHHAERHARMGQSRKSAALKWNHYGGCGSRGRSDAVIMRHPAAIRTIAKMIAALV